MATLLLVDDDQDILNFGKRVLASVGYDVMTAKNAREACDLLNTHSFDMVISDANMPEHTGFDLIKVLRSDARFKTLPIALLTARRDKKDIEHAIKLGVDDYIVKPIDPTLLVKKVEALFGKKPPQERASFDLQEIETKYTAEILLQAKILSVSEVGLVVETDQALFEGQNLHLKSHLFDHMRIEPPFLKVLSCESNRALKIWKARLLFVGADDSTLQKIRGWINVQNTNRSRKGVA